MSPIKTLGFAGRDRRGNSALFFTPSACTLALKEPLAVEPALCPFTVRFGLEIVCMRLP